MFTYVHCFPVIQHSECEPLGLYIGFSLSTILLLHVLTSILVCPTSDIHPVSISDYPHIPSSQRGLLYRGESPDQPPTYGASSLLGGIPHPS